MAEQLDNKIVSEAQPSLLFRVATVRRLASVGGEGLAE